MIKNGIYNGITSLLNIGLGVLVVPVLIRTMGLDAYGLWIFATAIVGIVELAEMGLSVSTTYFISKDLAKHDRQAMSETLSIIFALVLSVATTGGIVVWLLATPITHLAADLTPDQQGQAIHIIQLGAFIVWVVIVQRVVVGLQQAFQRYAVLNVIASTQSIVLYLAMLAVAFAGGGPEQLMIAYLVTTVTAFIANGVAAWRLLKPYRLAISWNRQRVPEIARYALSTWSISLGSALFSKGDRIIVGAVAGTATLGAYGAITSVVAKINQLSAAVVQPILPSISGLSSRESDLHCKLVDHYRQAVELNSLVSFGLSGMMLLLAPTLSLVLVDHQSVELVSSLMLAATVYGLYSLGAVPWYTLIARGRTMIVFQANLIASILALSLITIGAIQFGLLGAIAGNIGYLLILLLYIFAARSLNIEPGSIGFWKGIYVLWYIGVITLSIILPESVITRVSAAIIASIVLAWSTSLAKDILTSLYQIGSKIHKKLATR